MDRLTRHTLAAALVVTCPLFAADPDPAERLAHGVKLEGEVARKTAERLVKPGESERERWFKRLDEVYTGKVPPDPADWFDLITAGRSEWTRDTSRYFAEFHERICYRLDEKKDKVVTRDTFAAYAGRYLGPDSPPWRIMDLSDESRGIFKVLDVDRDNALSRAECTPALLERFADADADKDGKVNPGEYREFLLGRSRYETQFVQVDDKGKVVEKAKPPDPPKAEEPADPKPVVIRDYKDLPKEVPGWFRELDTDRDLQVGLYEWAAAKRPLPEFQAMDLNADGLLEVAEYLRWRKVLAQNGGGPPPDLRATAPGVKEKGKDLRAAIPKEKDREKDREKDKEKKK